MRRMAYLPVLAGLLVPALAVGKNIDLSTVPERSQVQLTIYNSEDLTLVRETRTLSFKKGNNPLQFSSTHPVSASCRHGAGHWLH